MEKRMITSALERTAKRKLWAFHSDGTQALLRHGIAVPDWGETGDLTGLTADKYAFREAAAAAYPDAGSLAVTDAGNVLYRLVYEIRTGDAVICAYGEQVYLGIVTGDYLYYPEAEHTEHQRGVRWCRRLPRKDFSPSALREIGRSPVRIFAVKRFQEEFLSALDGSSGGEAVFQPSAFQKQAAAPSGDVLASDSIQPVSVPSRVEPEPDVRRYILRQLEETLDSREFPAFVGDLLRAMGYAVVEFSRSGGAADLAVRRDELLPRVLVRARAGVVGEGDAAALERTLEGSEYGFLFTLRDLPREAAASLRTVPGIRVIDGMELADLILRHYGSLSERYRSRIPLRMIFVPMG